MAVRLGFTIRCCKELVKYVQCLLVVMQFPNTKWRLFFKIKIFMSGKKQEKFWKSQGILLVKKRTNPVYLFLGIVVLSCHRMSWLHPF